MKKVVIFLIAVSLFGKIYSQKITHTWAAEMIFGFSNAKYTTPKVGETIFNNNKAGSITDAMRFTIWFHLGYYTQIDFNKRIGICTGITNRNIGFISKEKASAETADLVKWKRRAYALGIPLAIKLGKIDKGLYFMFGVQYEMLYHYKEKEFLPSGKRKHSEWFSKKVNMFMPSAFIGITFPDGLSVKVTYTLKNMMNKNYSYNDDNGLKIEPYKHLTSNLIYISVYSLLPTNRSAYRAIVKERKL